MREASVRKIMTEKPFATKELRLHGNRRYVVPGIEYFLIASDYLHIRLPRKDVDEFIPFTAIASIRVLGKNGRKNGDR